MKVLVEGLFSKNRLLEYIRDFVVFEEANDKITKKGAKYHQFFAVRLAAEKTSELLSPAMKDELASSGIPPAQANLCQWFFW